MLLLHSTDKNNEDEITIKHSQTIPNCVIFARYPQHSATRLLELRVTFFICGDWSVKTDKTPAEKEKRANEKVKEYIDAPPFGNTDKLCLRKKKNLTRNFTGVLLI